MGRERTFESETEGLSPDNPAYKAIEEKYKKLNALRDERNRQMAQKHKMVLRILELVKPAQHLNVSKLSAKTPKELIAIGLAAKALKEALKISSDSAGFAKDKWSDY